MKYREPTEKPTGQPGCLTQFGLAAIGILGLTWIAGGDIDKQRVESQAAIERILKQLPETEIAKALQKKPNLDEIQIANLLRGSEAMSEVGTFLNSHFEKTELSMFISNPKDLLSWLFLAQSAKEANPQLENTTFNIAPHEDFDNIEETLRFLASQNVLSNFQTEKSPNGTREINFTQNGVTITLTNKNNPDDRNDAVLLYDTPHISLFNSPLKLYQIIKDHVSQLNSGEDTILVLPKSVVPHLDMIKRNYGFDWKTIGAIEANFGCEHPHIRGKEENPTTVIVEVVRN